MKNLLRLLMLISLGVTIYTIAVWEPKRSSNYSVEEKSKEIFNDNVDNSVNIDNLNTKVNESKSIFKVSKETMESSMTEENINKVQAIIKNMSEVDIDKIRKEEKDEDKERGTEEIFKILNKRLSSKDYKTIRSIYDPYINFANIQ
ncbi:MULTISPECIES: hypothetical protein [Clostridium]|uniref:Uncharacterized protein n=1 Tax=Clostridium cibarium TaxID=2762247 RepID=A0ABR8PWY1_9CLOT|nr:MULTISPECIES: hypothetical protein [Clostridium]MBD7912663.1 hypothetical protein [Clostridium cibarium]